MDHIAPWHFFLGTVAVVLLAVELGFRIGRVAHRHSKAEKEAPVAAMGRLQENAAHSAQRPGPP